MGTATLEMILEIVGAPTLAPWCVPPGRAQTPLTDVVIYDRHDQDLLEAGAIVLGVGLDGPQTVDLIRAAGDRGVAAVVTRGEEGDKDLLMEAANRHGMALLAKSPGLGWVRIGSLLRNALSTTGTPDREHDAELPNQDLTAVANTLASAVNGSVVIFSPQQQILAASRLHPDDDPMRHRAVTDQHGPAAYREHLAGLGVYKRLWGTDEVVAIPPVPELRAGRRQAIAIRAGEEILGSIWVAEGSTPLAEDSADTLRNAAGAASGHLVWLQARAQADRRFSEGLLLQLLSGDADVAAAASWLGVQADQPCAVMAAWTPDPGNRRRLSGLLAMHFSAYRHTTMPVVSRSTVDLVFCDLGRAGLVLEGVRDLVTRSARSLGQQVLAAVGTVQPTLEGLPRSARDADAALRALRRQGTSEGTRVVAFDEVRTTIQLDRLLHHLGRHADLLEGRVRVLRDWDRRNDGELAESLLAYLEAFGNVAEGARRIHVHPNTLRYRVRKACAVSEMDLDDPEQRLMAHLQLAALRLS
jgi:hypothetical protein